jgi:integrase/recombinase XerD
MKRLKDKDVPLNKSYVTHRFKAYVRECGLSEEFHLHSLRHTYSTHLIQKGVPIDIVQKLLGHSSPKITADNYDHSVASF